MINPYISIIMPVYNCERYLHQSIDSVLKQTFTDIELICVDDCSTDGSWAIIEEYEKRDNRVKLVRHKNNMGEMPSRYDGVLAAVGQFIMFLDSDDELVNDACEKLQHITRQQQADIYGFGTQVVCPDEKVRRRVQRYFTSYGEWLYGHDILRKSFIGHKVTRNIWDKMYSAPLCKKAFKQIMEDFKDQAWFTFAEDSLGFLYIAYSAELFFGINEPLYRYHYGRGIMHGGVLSPEQFEKYCLAVITAGRFCDFFAKRGITELFNDVIEAFCMEMFYTCSSAWHDQIADENKLEAMQLMMRYWLPVNDAKWLTTGLSKIIYSLEQELKMLKNEKTWEVPFSVLPRGKRIVLYGAGDMGKDYHRQIIGSGYCEIALWVDKNYVVLQESGLSVSAPDDIATTDYEYVLIAIRDAGAACEAKSLLAGLGVAESAIIWHKTTNKYI